MKTKSGCVILWPRSSKFTNKNRVLWMAADHKHATLLVELIRDSDFHSDAGGEMVYRVELWYFENYFGAIRN